MLNSIICIVYILSITNRKYKQYQEDNWRQMKTSIKLLILYLLQYRYNKFKKKTKKNCL